MMRIIFKFFDFFAQLFKLGFLLLLLNPQLLSYLLDLAVVVRNFFLTLLNLFLSLSLHCRDEVGVSTVVAIVASVAVTVVTASQTVAATHDEMVVVVVMLVIQRSNQKFKKKYFLVRTTSTFMNHINHEEFI